MTWLEVPFEEALARAAGRKVALKFEADWCSMCRDLDREVLKSQAGERLLEGLVGVRLDFDEPSTRPLVRRFAILDLPTVVIVDGEGVELGRVAGFSGAAAWVEAAGAALESIDPIGELEGRVAEARDEPTELRARLALAEALLSRDPDEAQAALEKLAWRDDAPDVAAKALFLLGRYLHRVLEEPSVARFVWRELATRFTEQPHARGAWWWYANAQAERGRPDVGSAALAERVRRDPRDAEAVIEWARFVGRTQHEPDRQRAIDAAMKASTRARGVLREQLEELVLQLGRGFEGAPPEKL